MPDSMNTPDWPAFEAPRPRPAWAGRAPGGGVDVAVAGRTGRIPRTRSGRGSRVEGAGSAGRSQAGAGAPLARPGLPPDAGRRPYSLRDDLGAKNCGRVDGVAALTADEHSAWRQLDPAVRSNAKAAFTLVTGVQIR